MIDDSLHFRAEELILMPARLMVDKLARHDFVAAQRLHDLLDQCGTLMWAQRELIKRGVE